MYAVSFFKSSLTKDQQVICKEKMMDCWWVSRNFKASQISNCLFSKQQSGKDFSAEDEEEWGKSVSLPEPSLRRKMAIRIAIQNDGEKWKGDAQPNPVDPGGVKPTLFHNWQNENPLHFVKSFLHIHIEKHEASFPFFEFVRVKKFMS